MRKYTLDETIFNNIDNEEKAYWLGFILADDSIQIRKSGQAILKLTLAIKDKNHIQKFLNFIKSNMPIKEYLVGNGANSNKSKSCEVTITSKQIVKDLEKLGIGQRKSHIVQIPTVKEEFTRHLIRGIWDGDGSVLYEPYSKKYPNNFNPRLQICGNKFVLNKINDIFEQKLSLSKSKLSPVKSIFLFRKSTNSAKKSSGIFIQKLHYSFNKKVRKSKSLY